MENTFDIYLTGQLLEGHSREAVVAGLTELFTLKAADALRLVDGTRRRVKTSCDRTTALNYRERLLAIGMDVAIERHQPAPSAGKVSSPPTQAELGSKAVSRDLGHVAQFDARDVGDKTVVFEPQPKQPQHIQTQPTEFSLAPVGSLLAESRTEVTPIREHTEFSLAAHGEIIPTLQQKVDALNPATDHLALEGDSAVERHDG